MKDTGSRRIVVGLFAGFFALPAAVWAADATTLAHLHWMTGVWRAHALGGEVEDIYETANNDELLSTMKLVVKGKVTRYELRSIREKDGKFIFQELAYGADLVPIDPVPIRTLVSSDDTHVNFEGLMFTRTGKNSMRVDLTIHTPDGKSREMKIDYTRALKFAAP